MISIRTVVTSAASGTNFVRMPLARAVAPARGKLVGRRLLGMTALLVTIVACSGGRPEPIEFTLNEENCSFCRMAVSQREFAAQVVTVTGSFDAFDDIGCLRDWVKEQKPSETAGIFVVDYEKGQWIDARTASYVLSRKLPTPMSSGLAAYQEQTSAENAAAGLAGEVLQWEEILHESDHE